MHFHQNQQDKSAKLQCTSCNVKAGKSVTIRIIRDGYNKEFKLELKRLI